VIRRSRHLRHALVAALLAGALAGALTVVATPDAGAQGEPLDVLILGDSFSAGNGAGDYQGTYDCHRSTRVWGELAADRIAAQVGREVAVTNRACSGAVARDIVDGTVANPEPRERELRTESFESRPFWNPDGRAAADRQARAFCEGIDTASDDEYWTGLAHHKTWNFYVPKCTQYITSQIHAVDDGYDLVLMTIGGNDAGFSAIGSNCLVIGVPRFGRDEERCRTSLRNAETMLLRTDNSGMRARVVRVMDQIQARLNPPDRTGPQGQVMLLSYPYLISNHDYEFGGIEVGARLKALSDRGDAVQREVMGTYSASGEGACRRRISLFGDGTKDEFGAHSVSAPINTNGSDDWWLWEVKLTTYTPPGGTPSVQSWETLHPKPDGHTAMANAAVTALLESGADGCADADSFILNRNDNGIEGENLQQTLESVGGVVERSSTLPTDLSGLDIVWVVMAYEGLTTQEIAALTAFIQSGGSVYLTGERPCCEALNATSEQVINNVIGLPAVQVGGLGDIGGPFGPNYGAAGGIAISPQRLVDFTPDAPGGMAGLGGVAGRNVFVSNGTVPVAGVWDESDMANGRGRLVILMDIDWLKESNRSQYAVNVYEFLAR
jgi:lysophospholipase L1-like esterase